MNVRERLIDGFLLPQLYSSLRLVPQSETDFICPQAFGRNTYSDKTVGKAVDAIRNKVAYRDIPTFEELRRQSFQPGVPNALLATLCYLAAQGTSKPVIGQWEVLYALWLRSPGWYAENPLHTPVWPPQEGYLGTRGLLLLSQERADELDLYQPLLVAHPEHIQRCTFLARRIFALPVGRLTERCSPAWFDAQSVQRWTRGPDKWLTYELLIARPHHCLHNWM